MGFPPYNITGSVTVGGALIFNFTHQNPNSSAIYGPFTVAGNPTYSYNYEWYNLYVITKLNPNIDNYVLSYTKDILD